MHHNPVKRGLVKESGQWRWSRYRYYAHEEVGPVFVNEKKQAVMRFIGNEVVRKVS